MCFKLHFLSRINFRKILILEEILEIHKIDELFTKLNKPNGKRVADPSNSTIYNRKISENHDRAAPPSPRQKSDDLD